MALGRKIATVGGGTLLSRLLAYARDAGIAALLGAGPFSEAFFAVMQVINFFRRLLAEGALNGAFVPLWLDLRAGADGPANADRFSRRALLAMFCIAGSVALLVIISAPWLVATVAPGFGTGRHGLAVLLLLIVAPYIALAALVAVLAAALNAEGRVTAAAGSVVAFNLVMVAAVGIALGTDASLYEVTLGLAAAVVIAGLTQFVITGAAWLATGKRWRRVHTRVNDRTRALLRRALPGLIAAGVPQLKLIAVTAIVSSAPAAVAWLYYANRLYELPLGVASAAIAAVMIPRIAAGRRADGDDAYTAALSRTCEISLGLALPAAAGFALLAGPITTGLFERGAFTARDTEAVATALVAICAGLPGHVLEKWLGAASFAHDDTRTPMVAALLGLASAVGAGLLLFWQFGFVGAVAAFALSGWVGTAALGATLYRRGWLRLDEAAAYRLPRIALATAIMAVAVAAGDAVVAATLPPSTTAAGTLPLLAALVTLGVVVYAGTLEFLGVVRLRILIAALRG
jgi:putative peptidoglycan lipid II flippase